MLSAAIGNYVAIKRASGFLYRVHNYLLVSYAAFAESRGDTHVRSATALAWATLAPTAGQRTRRLRIVAQFARFAAVDDSAHQIPADTAFGRPAPRRLPHIYTRAEIGRLLAAAAALGPRGSLRPKTYCTLFGLLAATGLRISEALALGIQDLTPEGLIIRETKFRKNRLVPIHPTSRRAIMDYLVARRCRGSDPHLFVSNRGTALQYPTVFSLFLRLVRMLGLRPRSGGSRGPRIHDLRHTFAVRSLEQCVARRDSVARHMLALSTYLGHGKIEHTYWYLQATPALMGQIAEACESLHTGGMQ
jgi:integrase